ncbi:NADPH oxidase organizer 1 [Pelobates cultripes]|uniref:NADPH oxidase organizer 1, partial n=3 Tax=Pelobates cultripes TaxID=61616 RepID=A0AAD1STW9_PELCU|nr:NADPH oxidase organizer 1 [Pelobates cultripes]
MLQLRTQRPSDKGTYMFSVLWSDHNKVLIYRTFAEFKKFQSALKKQFPLEAGALKKSERIIPKLNNAPRSSLKRRSSKKCLNQLQILETYSRSLLKLDANISQSSCVVQFFTLQSHDLNPSFPEDSLVIMPSEKKEDKPVTATHDLDVSGPMVTLKYLCMADFETIDLKNRPFEVKKNQILDVLLKENTGWWLVENEDRQLAWFPAPYLKVHRDSEEYYDDDEHQPEGTFCVVLKAYEAQNWDEMSVHIGVVVKVLKKSNSGWWYISYNGRTGYIPSIILKPYTNPCERFQSILRREHSTPNIHKGILNKEDCPYLFYSSSLESQSEDENSQGQRERLKSLGEESLGSEARSCIDLDVDSLMECSKRSDSASGDDYSSIGSSILSLSTFDIPKIPARPDADDIMQKCSTITKRAVQNSLKRLSLKEAQVSSQSCA